MAANEIQNGSANSCAGFSSSFSSTRIDRRAGWAIA
jgi:hypothetical protein